MDTSLVVNRIVDHVRELQDKKRLPLAVFDLDGTIVDYAERTRQILRDAVHADDGKFASYAGIIENIPIDSIAYFLEDTLDAIGITDQEARDHFSKTWWKDFFTNAYLHYDKPIPGAVQFVNRLFDAGATIVYLTGRDAKNMLEGTVRSLSHLGFPVNIPGSILLMKTDFDIDNLEYKISSYDYIDRLGEVIAIFENETEMLHRMMQRFPGAGGIYLNTGHSPEGCPCPPEALECTDFSALADALAGQSVGTQAQGATG